MPKACAEAQVLLALHWRSFQDEARLDAPPADQLPLEDGLEELTAEPFSMAHGCGSLDGYRRDSGCVPMCGHWSE